MGPCCFSCPKLHTQRVLSTTALISCAVSENCCHVSNKCPSVNISLHFLLLNARQLGVLPLVIEALCTMNPSCTQITCLYLTACRIAYQESQYILYVINEVNISIKYCSFLGFLLNLEDNNQEKTKQNKKTFLSHY